MTELRRRIGSKTSRPGPNTLADDGNYGKSRTIVLSPLGALFLLFVIGLSFIYVGAYFNDKLPTVRPENDNRSDFIAQKALKILTGLSEIGPKVTGSHENEIQAVNFITERITDVMKKTLPRHNITYDLQKASGHFSLAFLSKEVDLVYANVQNVIVKIGPKTGSHKSLLLNCHFDSVPVSPGASDDGLNCAVMLEILRVLATSDENLSHNVIFLFNGAEENPLLASHGFITKHKWAKEVKAFINLESCGAGGREVLFQGGPRHPWLIQSYAKAAQHPSGLVVGEEIFQSGLVPSDTDFRIFRDYGKIPGLDFAHCKNGFVYHTRYDNIESIENVLGVIQHTGDNILSLTKTLLNSKEFEDPEKYSDGHQVYYDVFGLFFVSYSMEMGKALSSICVILVFIAMYFTMYLPSWNVLSNLYRTMIAGSIMHGTTIISLIYNLFLAHFLDLFGFSMSWYSNSIMIIPLYVLPTIIIMSISVIQFDKYDEVKTHNNTKMKSHCLSVLIFWTSLLFISTFFNIRSSYLLLMLVLPQSIYTVITSILHPSNNRVSWTLMFVGTSIPSSLYFTYVAISAFRLFIPITGRSGAERNPELIISILATLFTFAIFSYISVIILTVRKRWIAIYIMVISHLLAIMSVFILPSLFPFTPSTPQRVSVTHVNRQFFNTEKSMERSDSLFWVQNMDRQGRNVLPMLNDAPVLEKFCEKDGYCGLPWFSKLQERSACTCISSAPHNINDETHLDMISRTVMNKNLIRYDFNISGPDHMGFIFTPSPDVVLKAWSLPRKISKNPSYFVSYVHGLYNPLWNVWFEVEVQDSHQKTHFKIEIYGLYFHHQKHFSNSFVDLLSQFPQWTHVTPALAMYKSFMF